MTNTLTYTDNHMGNYIDRWIVRDVNTNSLHHYTTERGAIRKFESITGHATLYRETDVVNADVEILSK